MELLILLLIYHCISVYCEHTKTPGCKAVTKSLNKIEAVLAILVLITFVVAVLGVVVVYILN